MSKTHRWRHKPHNQFKLKLRPQDSEWNDPIWKQQNPIYYKHERKIIRMKIHRQTRRNNKILIQKGWDYEPEIKTNGWRTH